MRNWWPRSPIINIGAAIMDCCHLRRRHRCCLIHPDQSGRLSPVTWPRIRVAIRVEVGLMKRPRPSSILVPNWANISSHFDNNHNLELMAVVMISLICMPNQWRTHQTKVWVESWRIPGRVIQKHFFVVGKENRRGHGGSRKVEIPFVGLRNRCEIVRIKIHWSLEATELIFLDLPFADNW